LPTLVDRSRLTEGNSKLALSSAFSEMAGPGLAGLLVQVLSAPIAILFDAISFLVSVVSLLLIRRPEPLPAPPLQRLSVLQELREGLRFIWATPVLRALTGVSGMRSFFGNFFGVLYSLYAVRELGISPALLGITIAAGGAGDIFGAFTAVPITRRLGLRWTLIGALLISSLVSFAIPLAGGLPWQAAGYLIFAQLLGDGLRSVYEINQVSLRQSTTPNRLLGRTNAGLSFVGEGIGPLGALTGGALAQVIGTRPTLFIAAGGMVLSVLWLALSSEIRKAALTRPPTQAS
jgi:predicted MFS family arabinose efflux permease